MIFLANLVSQVPVKSQLFKIHETYVAAGADLITTSSYQATCLRLIDAGLLEEAEQIIALTVQLAKDARDKVWATLDDSEG
ncbi:MAG: homocysteine S-methyltransferase family protein [Streptococcus salivarius]